MWSLCRENGPCFCSHAQLPRRATPLSPQQVSNTLHPESPLRAFMFTLSAEYFQTVSLQGCWKQIFWCLANYVKNIRLSSISTPEWAFSVVDHPRLSILCSSWYDLVDMISLKRVFVRSFESLQHLRGKSEFVLCPYETKQILDLKSTGLATGWIRALFVLANKFLQTKINWELLSTVSDMRSSDWSLRYYFF